MKTLTYPSIALCAAALALSACKSEPETFNTGTNDPMAAELANAGNVALPPMLRASTTYRCKDNSLIFVDFMTDDVTANLRTEKGGPITGLKAPEAGQPFVSADGATKLEGAGETVTYNGQACKAG
ncbi:hypothetical protein M2341_000766 [Sphingobium sp. B7D2B]|uniref:hypothetical protein n=1 Tax=unclassified Sphingobium TaxID=2611147 RepID=UPI0022251952|nr:MULTISPECIES: hypothetical protein [unclassified Sphingobium]MCW2365319.1 hypothetical protein [Sphingobium sp. B7D2B]MCW2413181.1 hypothetical protein [Sphingobium sp. B8D3D]MCW2414521.1 hypothetical protein [Sphingobium sp. B8D3A]